MPFVIVQGDLLTSKEPIIAHQCNCVTTKGKGLSEAMFAKYPYSEVYSSSSGVQRVPGENIICDPEEKGPIIVAMIGQHLPGPPTPKETAGQRIMWFKECLEGLGMWMKNNDKHRIAFPYKIGCGLARGNWTVYEHLLKEFQQKYGLTVTLYKQED